MAKEKYMALADYQTLWTDTIKPFISSTYAKQEDIMTSQQAGTLFNSIFNS